MLKEMMRNVVCLRGGRALSADSFNLILFNSFHFTE